MRTSQGSLAWITRWPDGRLELLTQWNRRWEAYSLVGGHRLEAETFRACVAREVAEELGLGEGKEFHTRDSPRARLEYTAWSESAKEETVYTLEVFEVILAEAEVEAKVSAAPENRWLTIEEIQAGVARDGKLVSATVRRVLETLLSGPGPSEQRESLTDGIDLRKRDERA